MKPVLIMFNPCPSKGVGGVRWILDNGILVLLFLDSKKHVSAKKYLLDQENALYGRENAGGESW